MPDTMELPDDICECEHTREEHDIGEGYCHVGRGTRNGRCGCAEFVRQR